LDHAFGRSGGFTLGIEEELLLVDPETHGLTPVAERLLAAIELPEGAAGHEAYAAEIELRTPITRDVDEATAALRRGRAAAREAGATLLGAGVHPAGELGDAAHVDSDRYRRAGEAMRGLLRRTPECALHVHVGMPDPATAIKVFNGVRAYLPLLQGLSANSPFWFGRDSGLASARSALVRSYPGRGVPRAFRDFDEWVETVEATATAGHLDDYTFLWWDVRPHPRLGTVELREMDAQSRLEDVAALAGLIHALAVEQAELPGAKQPPAEAIAYSCFRASRDGLEATILDEGRLRPLREVAAETVDRLRPHARQVAADGALEEVERLLEGGGADRQRAAHANGGMSGLLSHLAAETASDQEDAPRKVRESGS